MNKILLQFIIYLAKINCFQGVTVLLAFFVNSLVVSNYTPESASVLPVIGKFVECGLCLVY